MLTSEQLRLSKTAEEATEVAKECLKGQIFGTDSVHNGEMNCELIREECLDLLVCIRLLERMRIIRRIKPADISKHFAKKRPKIVRRTADSIRDGHVEPAAIGDIPEAL